VAPSGLGGFERTATHAVTPLHDSRVHYVKRAIPSKGKPALVRNEAIQRAEGRDLYFLDDDDYALPGALRALSSGVATNIHPVS
jgi:glycosyltransferase involved in cell wall biosynthesis